MHALLVKCSQWGTKPWGGWNKTTSDTQPHREVPVGIKGLDFSHSFLSSTPNAKSRDDAKRGNSSEMLGGFHPPTGQQWRFVTESGLLSSLKNVTGTTKGRSIQTTASEPIGSTDRNKKLVSFFFFFPHRKKNVFGFYCTKEKTTASCRILSTAPSTLSAFPVILLLLNYMFKS